MSTSRTIALAAALLAVPSSLAAQDLLLRVRAPQDATVFLLFATGSGPALRFPGIGGALRLDLGSLLVLRSGTPVNGFSTVKLPGLLGLPPQLLRLQTLVASPRDVSIGPVSLPIADHDADVFERALPALGPLGGNGAYLFGMTRTQIVDTARRYGGAAIDENRLLASMQRPFDRATCEDMARDLGMVGACEHLHAVWEQQLRGVAAATVAAQAAQDVARRAVAFLQQTFPNGVPDEDEYWGEMTALDTTTASRDYTTTSGNRRIKLEIRLYDYGSYGTAYATAYSYKKVIAWWTNKADKIKVSGSVSSDWGSASFGATDYDSSSVSDHYTKWGSGSGVYSMSASGSATWDSTTLSASGSCST